MNFFENVSKFIFGSYFIFLKRAKINWYVMKLYSISFLFTLTLSVEILGRRELAIWFFSCIVFERVSNVDTT